MGKGRDIYSYAEKPIGQMLLHIAMPIILSLMVQAVYTLVDGIYVSHINETAMTAVSLAFIVQNLEVAIFSGLATGINAVISKALGAQQKKEARNAVLNGIVLQLVFSLLFVVLGFVGTRFYFATSTKDTAIIQDGVSYLLPCLVFSPVLAMQMTSERFLQAVGQTRYVLYAQLVGSVSNILLDPIFIFGFGPWKACGIAGAAYATIISQILSLLVLIYFNKTRNEILFNGEKMSLDLHQVGAMCSIGIPSSFMGISNSIGNYAINRIILGFSSTALAAYGIYIKLQSVLIMPAQGTGVALVTIFAFFYGQKNMKKLKEAIKCGTLMLFSYGLLCALMLFFLPSLVLAPFGGSAELKAVAAAATRVIGLTYVCSLATHSITAFFQATDRSYLSFVFITARMFVARIPMAYIFSRTGVLNYIWWCYPVSEVISDAVVIYVFYVSYRKVQERMLQEHL